MNGAEAMSVMWAPITAKRIMSGSFPRKLPARNALNLSCVMPM